MLSVVCFYTLSILISIPFMRFMRYYEARFFSLLVLSLASFALSYFMPFKFSFYTCLIAVLIISALTHRNFRIDRSEIVFLVVFSFFTLLRFLNPDIFDCEKLMDVAFLSAVLKAKSFPPNDPFFAGGKIDFYYYFGHVIAASITLMSFTEQEIGYNIAIAALPAYTTILIFGFLKEFIGEKLATFGLIYSIFSGNLYSVFDLIRRVLFGLRIDFSYYWNCTRVIKETINEFPYFSFIHADLHAHVVAIPIKVFYLICLFRALNDKKYSCLIAPTLFAIFATNSWDFPLMLIFTTLVAIISKNRRYILIFTSISVLFVYILYSSMNTPSAKPFLVYDRTDLIQFLSYSAFPIFLAYSYYLLDFNKKKLLALYILSIPLYLISPILTVLIPLAVISVYRITKSDFFSIAILVGVLSFLIPDFFGIESRMNTVFKFYLIGWLFLTIPACVKLKDLFSRCRPLYVILVVLCLIYPIFATPIRYNSNAMTLDGMNYMKNLYGDYDAIKWLRKVDGVVLEGGHMSYRYGGRVAAFTGNPTVVAWANHEVFWRANGLELAKRLSDVRKFYTTDSCEVMREIVKKYNVSFVFVGYEERVLFKANPEVIGKCFKKVFESRGTYVFSVY